MGGDDRKFARQTSRQRDEPYEKRNSGRRDELKWQDERRREKRREECGDLRKHASDKYKDMDKRRDDEKQKLDWMYKSGAQLVNREDYLLGRTVDKSFDLLEAEEKRKEGRNIVGVKESINHVEYDCLPVSLRAYRNVNTTDQVDMQHKILEDPLTLIKRKEMENVKKLLDNPVRMKEMQQKYGVQKMRAERSEKERSSKKRKNKRSKRTNSSCNSDTDANSGAGSSLDKRLEKKLKKLKGKLSDKEAAKMELSLGKILNKNEKIMSKGLAKSMKLRGGPGDKKRSSKKLQRRANSSRDSSSSASSRSLSSGELSHDSVQSARRSRSARRANSAEQRQYERTRRISNPFRSPVRKNVRVSRSHSPASLRKLSNQNIAVERGAYNNRSRDLEQNQAPPRRVHNPFRSPIKQTRASRSVSPDSKRRFQKTEYDKGGSGGIDAAGGRARGRADSNVRRENSWQRERGTRVEQPARPNNPFRSPPANSSRDRKPTPLQYSRERERAPIKRSNSRSRNSAIDRRMRGGTAEQPRRNIDIKRDDRAALPPSRYRSRSQERQRERNYQRYKPRSRSRSRSRSRPRIAATAQQSKYRSPPPTLKPVSPFAKKPTYRSRTPPAAQKIAAYRSRSRSPANRRNKSYSRSLTRKRYSSSTYSRSHSRSRSVSKKRYRSSSVSRSPVRARPQQRASPAKRSNGASGGGGGYGRTRSKPRSRSRSVPPTARAATKPAAIVLTEEQKELRRREMMDNAVWRDADRTRHVQRHREDYAREEELQKNREYNKAFTQTQVRKALDNHDSVGSRIRANIAGVQRNTGAMDRPFARH